MDDRQPEVVEDFTGICLFLGWVNLTWIMFALLEWQGWAAIILVVSASNFAITQLDLWLTEQRNRYAPGRSQRQ